MGRLSVNDHKLINAWELGETVKIKFKDGREDTFKILLFDVENLTVILEPAAGGERLRVLTKELDEVIL